jgi:hypothetical protein
MHVLALMGSAGEGFALLADGMTNYCRRWAQLDLAMGLLSAAVV